MAFPPPMIRAEDVPFRSRTLRLRSQRACGYYLQDLAFSMKSVKQALDLLSCFDRVVLFFRMPRFLPSTPLYLSSNPTILYFFTRTRKIGE